MARYSVCGLLIAILACAGCGSAANAQKVHPDAMMPQMNRPIYKSPSSVVVAVLRAHTTPAMLLPRITSEDFTQALRQSIEHSGLFAQAKKGGLASYELQAFIAQVDQPMFSHSTTVSMEVNYTLARMQPRHVVWEKMVTSTYTVPFHVDVVAATRALLATEGAARTNIEQAIQEMSQLQLE
jgi:hypothetical protein